MMPKDILGRDLEPGQWVAIGHRQGSCGAGLSIRQIAAVEPWGREPVMVPFFRMITGRRRELKNPCLILDSYAGPEVG